MTSILDTLSRRHGVLRYRDTPVEREKITQVLEAAIAAPSPANTQPWAFVVVTEPERVQRVAAYLVQAQEEFVFRRLLGTPEDFIAHLMRLYEALHRAPCFVVMCRDRRVDLAADEHAALVRDWELCSLGAAMANLMAEATGLGLGTRWFGSPMMDTGKTALHVLLDIPARVEVVAVTPLGYHDEPPKERPVQPAAVHTGFRRGDKHRLAALLEGKLAPEDVVHFHRYGGQGQEV